MREDISLPKEAEQTARNDKKLFKKAVRKDTGRIGWGLLIYMLLSTVIVAADMINHVVGELFRSGAENVSAEMVEELLAKQMESASSTIFAVLTGLLFLWLFMGKKAPVKTMFEPKKRMTAGTFFQLLAVFMSAQTIFGFVSGLLESGLNLIGYSAMESIEAASDNASTVSMFLYASFIAPFAEEMIYRGFVAEPLRKYGKVFAIVVSAVLFGVMHGNIPQAMFAAAVGLVLAYTAMEYSLTWSIALHVVNNFVFGELASRTTGILSYVADVLLFALFAVGIAVLWKQRKAIRQYIEENKAEKGAYGYAFTTVPIILFILWNLINGISMLTPIA